MWVSVQHFLKLDIDSGTIWMMKYCTYKIEVNAAILRKLARKLMLSFLLVSNGMPHNRVTFAWNYLWNRLFTITWHAKLQRRYFFPEWPIPRPSIVPHPMEFACPLVPSARIISDVAAILHLFRDALVLSPFSMTSLLWRVQIAITVPKFLSQVLICPSILQRGR